MASSLKSALDRGIASVTVKSSTFLETSKYSNQIHIAQDAIAKLKTNMGASLYEAWKAGQPLDEIIGDTCRQIAGYEEQIAQLQQKIEDVKNESRQALGKPPAAQTAAAQAAPAGETQFCPECGSQNKLSAKFCFKCGTKLADL